MDKTSEKVTKDPKCVEAGCKDRKNFMNKLKEDISDNAKKGSGDTTNTSNETTCLTNNASNETTSPTNNTSNETISTNNTTTTRSNDNYIYGVGMLAVLAISVCVFFTSQAKNKKLTMIAWRLSMSKNNHQNDVISFRKIYNKMSSFDWKKNIEDSHKDGVIITIGAYFLG